jgi:plastocyanin
LDNQDDSHAFFRYKIKVNDTKPIWLYCSQATHCMEGMVAAVNAPPTGNTIAAFQALAIKSNISNPVIPVVTGGTIIPPERTVHSIIVGGGDGRLVYEPSNITAKMGDVLHFVMRSKNHSGATFSLLILHDWLI